MHEVHSVSTVLARAVASMIQQPYNKSNLLLLITIKDLIDHQKWAQMQASCYKFQIRAYHIYQNKLKNTVFNTF